MSRQATRDRIVEAADQLFYEQGFEHTSFAQIADAVGISRGNFYYHFKTKNDILAAVIELRITRTRAMLDDWESQGDTPAERIRCFINILIMNRANIKRFGCPLGSLSMELGKLAHPARTDANRLFTLFRKWLTRQFRQLGLEQDADALAMHLLAFSQGVATLASAFHDEKFLRAEAARLNLWLDNCIDGKNSLREAL